MEQRRSKKWIALIPTAALLASLLLLGFTYRNFNLSATWSSEDLAAGIEPKLDIDLGHGPVVQTTPDANEISLHLHPEDHAHRKSRITELHWNITKSRRRPDGVAKDVYLVNGQFPGPTVEVRAGDEVIVKIHNSLVNESTSIHWHGLRIANDMDGVVGITQCAILPGDEYQYRLRIPEGQSGTFWYHSHSETQRADGLFGALIVHAPASEEMYPYDEDQVLLAGDWYHGQAADVLESYTDWKNFKIEPAPDSLLLNGRGYFECSRATRHRPVDCEKNEVPHLTFAGRARLRVVNVGALTGFTISMVGYTATLVSVDGDGAVELVRSEKVGILYPGERIDLILERRDEGDYPSAWVTVALDRENMQFPNMALIDTQQFPVASHPLVGSRTQSGAETVPWIDLSKTRGVSKSHAVYPPSQHDQTILIYTTISYLTQYEYRPKGFINHTSWIPSPETPPLITQERSEWPRNPEPLVERVEQDHWTELVINNLDDKGHPFHLHGHEFFVLEVRRPERPGSFEQYNPFNVRDRMRRNSLDLQSPVKKDTVYVPSMGYAVLRFRATNPGIWLLHCHVLWHEAVGMNMAIQIGPDAGIAQREAASTSCGS